jgi:hypothetical protein
VNNNLKALKKFADDVLPETLDEKAMRERAFKGARDAISLDKLPQHLDAALDTALVVAQVKLLTTPYLQGLEAADRDDVFAKLQIESKKVLIDYTTAETGLPGLRASVLANMSRSKDVPYFFGAIGEVSLDVEKAFVGLLSDASKGKMNGGSLSNRTAAERAAALESLLSFKGRRTATAALAAVKAQLEEESAAATSSEQRELLEELLAMFEPAADEEA